MKSTHRLLLVAALTATSAAHAVGITSYDIYGTPLTLPGGGWSHTYSGSITPNGAYFNYLGGSGTLNDGLVPSSLSNNHFLPLNASPEIALYLSSPSTISSIELFGYGGGFVNNYIPGAINGVTVTINGISESFTTEQFGPSCLFALYLCNDRVSFVGTTLANQATSKIVLSLFSSDFSGYINIAEIAVNASPIPEPTTTGLLCAGLLALLAASYRARLSAKSYFLVSSAFHG